MRTVPFRLLHTSERNRITQPNPFTTMNETEQKKKITWVNVVNAIIQALIAALTALGVTSCVPFIHAWL